MNNWRKKRSNRTLSIPVFVVLLLWLLAGCVLPQTENTAVMQSDASTELQFGEEAADPAQDQGPPTPRVELEIGEPMPDHYELLMDYFYQLELEGTLDEDIYAGLVWIYNDDKAYEGYLQATDPAYFDPYLEEALQFGAEFEVRQVKYSIGDLRRAQELLKANAKELQVRSAGINLVSNCLEIETDDCSEENKQALAEFCGVDNLYLSDLPRYGTEGERILYY